MTSTFAAPVGRGRHRLGKPGRVPVTAFVTVVYRSLVESWRRPGRHRRLPAPRPTISMPAPAHASDGSLIAA